MSRAANEKRGEVDLVLDSATFILRPSHEAILAIEGKTGRSAIALANAATDGEMTNKDAAIITTELIQAWGRAVDDPVAKNVDIERIGQLLHEYGIMRVILRLALVLTMAVTGGCKADGTPKEGEVMPVPGRKATPGAGSTESQLRRSGGRRTNSGARPRTSSGARTKSGAK